MTSRQVRRKAEPTRAHTGRTPVPTDGDYCDRPTPHRLLAEGKCSDFVLPSEVLQLRQVMAKLRQERERLGITLATLSERTGIDQAALSRLESGRNANPTLGTLCRVAEALGKMICCTCQDVSAEGRVSPRL
jgi:DNA-binding XRE family transcriptional regulator